MMRGNRGGRGSFNSVYNYFTHTSTTDSGSKKYSCKCFDFEMDQNPKRMEHHLVNVFPKSSNGCRNVFSEKELMSSKRPKFSSSDKSFESSKVLKWCQIISPENLQ